MKTPIAASSAFAAIIGLYGITPAVAESFDDQRPDRADWTSARQAPAVHPSERRPAELPAAQTQNGITFVTGGIGKSEAAAMKAAAKRHDLMLVFADREGHYLADVNVKIKDMKGNTVLDTVSDPILLADLPSGRYTIQADADGKSFVKTFSVTSKTGGRPTEFVYRWPTRSERGA
ncbi:MAG: hypothetical protein IPM75_15195 [Candidatus Competibacteraceae bacterium]|nr:hypothetical protein [Candidatus Competibacteraceae bacterium]